MNSVLIAKNPKITLVPEFDHKGIWEISLKKNEDGFIVFSEKELPSSWYEWLVAYASKKVISLPFFIPRLTPFITKVWEGLVEIPFGKTLSYQEVAVKIGHPKAARAVGSACGKNLFPLFIPCHRVIASNKKIGGFSLDLSVKEELLRFEEIQI